LNPWLFLLPFVGSPLNSLVLRRRGLRHLESASLSVGWSAAVEVAETCGLGIIPNRRLCRRVICPQGSNADAEKVSMHIQKIVKWSETFIMMFLLFLLTLSYLESDSKAEILQRLVVSSSLKAIAAATDATVLRHWRITYKTGENPRYIDRRDISRVISRVLFFAQLPDITLFYHQNSSDN
jgi:hypothetical protein